MIYLQLDSEAIKCKKIILNRMLEHYQEMITILENNEIMQTFKDWNFKKYSKRLETKLNKIIDKDRFYFDTTLGGVYLQMCFPESRYIEPSESGLDYTLYVKGSYDYFGFVSQNSDTNYLKEHLDEFIKKRLKEIKLKAKKFEEQLNNINNYINQFKKIVDNYNELEEELDYNIRTELGLTLQRYQQGGN